MHKKLWNGCALHLLCTHTKTEPKTKCWKLTNLYVHYIHKLGFGLGVQHSPSPYICIVLSALYTIYIQQYFFKSSMPLLWKLVVLLVIFFQAPDSCIHTSVGSHFPYSIELLQARILFTNALLSCLFLVALTLLGASILSLLHGPSMIHITRDFAHKERNKSVPYPH